MVELFAFGNQTALSNLVQLIFAPIDTICVEIFEEEDNTDHNEAHHVEVNGIADLQTSGATHFETSQGNHVVTSNQNYYFVKRLNSSRFLIFVWFLVHQIQSFQ